jgi:DNA-binding Lrp family transcriptional regulator
VDKIDKQILEILTKNSRISASTIAKALNLSKNSIINRISSLQKQGFYKKDMLIIDSRVFGYTIYQIFIQLDSEIENKEEILNNIKNHDRVIWSNTFIGVYNLQIIVDAKNTRDFTRIKEEIFDLCENKIKKYTTLTHVYDIEFSQLNPEIIFNTKFPNKDDFSFSNILAEKDILKQKKVQDYSLSRIDIEILKELSKNPKIQLNDLADKLKIDWKTVKKKIKNLIDKKVISAFTTLLDTSKFGYIMYTMMVKLKPNTSDSILKKSFEKLNNIFYSARFFGEYDLLIYLYSKNPEELNKTISEFEKNMGSNITETQLLITDKILNWKQFTDGLYNELKENLS